MFALSDCRSDRRKAGFDCRNTRRGARDVELFPHSRVASELCETKRLALIGETPLGNGQLLLQTAQLEIVACDLGGDDHTNVIE